MEANDGRKYISESLKTPVRDECDVLVVGGGAAGIMSALAAAKNGARTILVESNTMLGGDMLSGGIVWLGFFNVYKPYNVAKKQLIKGVPEEVVKGLQKAGGSPGFYEDLGDLTQESVGTHVDREVMTDYLFSVMEEYGVKLYLKTTMSDIIKEGNEVKGIIIESKSGREAILSKTVVDASGDGDAAAKAGASFKSIKDHCIGMAFGMGNINLQTVLDFAREKNILVHLAYGDKGSDKDKIIRLGFRIGNIKELQQLRLESGIHTSPCILSSHENEGTYINGVNVEIGADGLDAEDLSKAIISLRHSVFKSAEFLRKYVPGFENAYLNWTSPAPGVRRTRCIECEFEITPSHIEDGIIPSDTIGLYGTQDAHYLGYEVKGGAWYGIPYRALLPKHVENLLVVGRMLSSDFVAHMSTRLIGACFLQGQAAGTAAALAAKIGVTPRNLDVPMLQRTLKKDGVFLGD